MDIEAEIQERGDMFPLIDHRRDRITVTMEELADKESMKKKSTLQDERKTTILQHSKIH